MIPLPRLMPKLAVPLRERFVSSDILRKASSWQNSFTVNCPIAYGICLDGAIVPALGGGLEFWGGAWDVLAEDGQEAGVETLKTLFACEFREAAHEAGGEFGVGDESDARRLEGR